MDTCRQIQEIITDCYMNRQELPADVQSHLESCTACKAHAHDMQLVFQALETFQPPEPGIGLARETMKKIESEAAKSRETVSWIKVALAAAGSFPVIAAIHIFWIFVILDAVGYVSPTVAHILRYVIIPSSLLLISLMYGTLPIFVGKYFSMQRG